MEQETPDIITLITIQKAFKCLTVNGVMSGDVAYDLFTEYLEKLGIDPDKLNTITNKYLQWILSLRNVNAVMT